MQSILYVKASDGTANASLMTVQNVRSPGANTAIVNTVSGAPLGGFFASMGAPHTFTDPITSEVITVISDATAVDFAGHINAGQVIIDAIAPGYADTRGSLVGDIIVIRPSTEWSNNIANILGAEHKDNGKHGNITADSIYLNTGQDVSVQGLYQNAIINGGCMVAQRPVPSLSTAYQYGQVDRFAVKATGTAVSAGTITQNTSSLVAASKGYEIKVAGVTVTGTGVVYLRHRIEAKDAMAFKNAAASISMKIYHDVGSSINATIFVNKANAADNFSATTTVANSGAIAVPTNAATLIKFENINTGSLGDVSNGIEIEVQLACGAVTTKNFSFGEIVLNLGAKYQPFIQKPFIEELARCERYYLDAGGGTTYTGLAAVFVGGSASYSFLATPVTMRTTPTLSFNSLVTRYGGADYGWSGVTANGLTNRGVAIAATTSGTGNGNTGTLTSSDGYLRFDAEL